MKRQKRRMLVWTCSCAVLVSNSVLFSPQPAQAKDPLSDSGNTELLVGAFVTVMAMATGPGAPIAIGAAKAMQSLMGTLGFFSKPDAVGEAIKAINARLDAIDNRMDSLEQDIKQNRNADFRRANNNNTQELRRHRDDIEQVVLGMQDKAASKNARDRLVLDAKQVCNTLMEDDSLWEWSDIAARDIKPKKSTSEADAKQNALINEYLREWNKGRPINKDDMMDPAFKTLPTLELYATALATWMTAMEFAANGDTAYVKNTYRNDLQRHIDFLTTRANWNEFNDVPQMLPEKIKAQVAAFYVPTSRRPDGEQVCTIAEYARDGMAREIRLVGNITYVARSANEMCNVPENLLNRASIEEEKLEQAYGMDVVALLAKKLTQLRDKGTLREQFIGTFDTSLTADDFNILYTVSEDGTLTWHRHQMRYGRGVKTIEKHTWVAPKRVGDGWKAGYRGAYPAGALGIYSLADDGTLRWHWHTGALNGTYTWREPSQVVGTGWTSFTKIIPMDKGVIYGVLPDGTLRWHKHLNYLNGLGGTSDKAWASAKIVHSGFDKYKTIFSGGNGILYAVGNDGVLYWFKHKDYLDKPAPAPVSYPKGLPAATVRALTAMWNRSWEGPKRVGDGWGDLINIFSPGEGHIYAVSPNGDLTYFRHTGWQTGAYQWDEVSRRQIDSGWDKYVVAFARNTTSDAGSGNAEVDIVVR